MLKECSKDELFKYTDFAYELALDLTKSGYPTYCDMIKTKSMFVERLMKAFDRDDEQILLYVQNNEVHGLIHYYWISDDFYLQTNGFYIDDSTEQALEEFLIFVGERFMGYDLFMGFPAENKKAMTFLSEHGFECIEDDFNNTAFLDRYDNLQKNYEIVQVTKENYGSFRDLHSQIEGDMYWNSDRIYDALDKWIHSSKRKWWQT